MPKSATDVMHDILATTAIDVAVAIKRIEGGLPNAVVRALGAIHANTTFADLPKEVRDAVDTSVRAAFNRLLKEGYVIANRTAPPALPVPREPGAPSRRSGPPTERSGPRPPRGAAGPKRGGGGKPPR